MKFWHYLLTATGASLIMLGVFVPLESCRRQNHNGEVGQPCKPDGTCIGKLVCVDPERWLGIPMEAESRCRVSK